MMNWPFWGELFVRSGVLLLAAEAARRVSKPAAAAFRHRLLSGAFVLLLLLPLMSIVLPSIPLSSGGATGKTRYFVTVGEISSRVVSTEHTRSVEWLLLVWACGVVVTCVPLAVGWLRALCLCRRAVVFESGEKGRGVAVLLSTEIRVPMTCGWFRPRILLPAEATCWNCERMEAILRHELAHIRRRDLLSQLAAHLISALWWFQPLVWLTRRNLRVESELACDAEVIRSGLRASSYAADLLESARCAGPSLRLSSSALGMIQKSDLETRLQAILAAPNKAWGRPKVFALTFSLVAVSMGASAVSVDAQTGGSMMKRTILSALLTSAGLSAATVGGSVHDLTGAAVADAQVSLLNPDTSVKQEAVTGTDGKFTLDNASAGQFILRIEKPGLATIFRVFDLTSDGKLDQDFTMPNQGGEAVPDTTGHSGAIRVGGRVAESNLTTKVQPVYPMAAKKAAIQGTVEIGASISKEGVPVELRVISSPSDDLSESALEAVRQWRYRPTLLNGQPVAIETTIVVNYTLSK